MKRIIIIVCCTLSSAMQATPYGDIFRKKMLGGDQNVLVALEKDGIEYIPDMTQEEVLEAHEGLRASYMSMQDALLDAALTQKSFVPAMPPSDKKVIAHERFLDRVLGHIAYGVHVDDPAIVLACQNKAVLSRAQTYVNDLNNAYKADADNRQCPICLELPVMKKMTVMCNQNHVVCIPCFNNTEIANCSLCRDALKYCKTELCQRCGLGKDFEFVRCGQCEVVSVLCKECTKLPCCSKTVPSSKTAADKNAIQTQALELIASIRKERDAYVAEQVREMDRVLEMEAKQFNETVEKDKAEADVLLEREKELGVALQKVIVRINSGDYTVHAGNYSINIINIADQHKKVIERLNTLHEVNETRRAAVDKKMDAIRDEYKQKGKNFFELKNREIESIKAMAEKSTGSVLNSPVPNNNPLALLLRMLLADQSN